MNKQKLVFGIVFLLLSNSYSQDEKDVGSSKRGSVGFKFLNIAVDARDASLGGNASMTGNASAAFVNPAGLASISGISVSAGSFGWLAESQAMHAAFAMPLMGGTVGAFYYSLDYGSFNRVGWTLSSDGSSAFDAGSETFGADDNVVGVSYGRGLSDKFSIGGSVKMVSENIDDYSVSAMGFDLGFQFATGYKNIQMGASISNFGADAQDADEEYGAFSLPTNFDFGLAGQVWGDESMGLVGVLNMVKFADLASQFALGGEFAIAGMAKLRGSYNLDSDHTAPLSFGAGVNVAGIALDLSYTIMDNFDPIMRISIGYSM